MSGDCDDGEILDLLNDEYARAILKATSAEPMSARTLSARCDASRATIYRRINRLQACDLLEEQLLPQSDGNHHKVFRSRLESFCITFDDGEVTVSVERVPPTEEHPADRFTRMWSDL